MTLIVAAGNHCHLHHLITPATISPDINIFHSRFSSQQA
jgi:hypothetical protein